MKLHKLSYKKISIYIVVLLLSIIGSIYWNRPKEHFDCDNKENKEKLDIINENIISIIEDVINKKLEEQTAGLGNGIEEAKNSSEFSAITAGANIPDK